MIRKKTISIAIISIFLFLSSCQVFNKFEPTPTPLPPTPTPLPPTELTICLGSEPESLYPYAITSQAANDVLQAIYDGPIDMVNGQATAVILESMPSFTDSTARFTAKDMHTGDPIVNIFGELTSLKSGEQVYPSGCTDVSCAVTWDGISELRMDQLTVAFNLRSDLTWSDGQPLTAADSVYSYKLAADADAPTDKTFVNLTASYREKDRTTVEWMGISGLVAENFEDYFWMPLPQHAWGSMSAAELLASEQVTHSPLGWGPYVVDEWVSGEYIRLIRNEQYYRADEGLPKYDYVTYKFITPGDVDQSVSGACDIVTSDVLDLSHAMGAANQISESGYDLIVNDSSEFEFLAFGISQASYDDGYYPYGADRPAIFSDVNTRRAIALCIDRQSILDELTGGLVDISSSYLSDENYLLGGLSLSQYDFDPAQAKALLEEVGWMDFDQIPETPLTMVAANANVPYGTSFSITLLSSRSEMRGLIAQRIAEDLAECGIEVTVQQDEIQNLYLPGPDGVIFGRNFDLALLSMNIGSEPHCDFFTTDEIPSESNYWLGTVTGGSNFMGYSSAAYDEACKFTRAAGLDTNVYLTGIQNTLQILSSDLPFIPLYHHPDFVLVKKELCLTGDISNSEMLFQSIESLDPYVSCNG